jgi:hypothetical protein
MPNALAGFGLPLHNLASASRLSCVSVYYLPPAISPLSRSPATAAGVLPVLRCGGHAALAPDRSGRHRRRRRVHAALRPSDELQRRGGLQRRTPRSGLLYKSRARVLAAFSGPVHHLARPAAPSRCSRAGRTRRAARLARALASLCRSALLAVQSRNAAVPLPRQHALVVGSPLQFTLPNTGQTP